MSGGDRGRMRVRFAPDPRANLNISGARIALVNWLFARHHEGDMVLRIEDRDPSREIGAGFDALCDNLRWMGLDWDEGPVAGGRYGPYRQSERIEIYESYLETLKRGGHVYECYCTPEELAASNREDRRQGRVPRYNGRCRDLTDEARENLVGRVARPAIRFRGPVTGHTPVNDMLRGLMFVDSRHLDDFIILRGDGVFTYNFCCVVDDVAMEISHVIRGEEHVSNTPRQLWLYEALEIEPPAFVHLGRITEPDGTQLRGGQRGSSIDELRRVGLMDRVLIRFLAGLDGMETGPDADLSRMAERFSPTRLRAGTVTFDRKRLYTLNARYLRSLPEDRLLAMVSAQLEKDGVWPAPGRDEHWLREALGLLRDEMVLLSDAVHCLAPLLRRSPPTGDRRLDQVVDTANVAGVLGAWVDELSKSDTAGVWDLREMAQSIRRRLGVQVRDVFMPLRVALTGRTSGPDMNALVRLIGREKVLARLKAAHRQLG